MSLLLGQGVIQMTKLWWHLSSLSEKIDCRYWGQDSEYWVVIPVTQMELRCDLTLSMEIFPNIWVWRGCLSWSGYMGPLSQIQWPLLLSSKLQSNINTPYNINLHIHGIHTLKGCFKRIINANCRRRVYAPQPYAIIQSSPLLRLWFPRSGNCRGLSVIPGPGTNNITNTNSNQIIDRFNNLF